MKKILYPLLLVLGFFSLNNQANAQLFGVDSITVNFFNLPDTITINDNYNHTVYINNQTATPYTGTIWLMAAVDTGAGLVDIDTVGWTNVTGFTQADTASISYNEIYSFPNKYKLGGNIVVVWPMANTGSTIDSLFEPVWILNQTGIAEVVLSEGSRVYPNPFNDHIYIETANPNEVKQVRLYDLRGRLVLDKVFQPMLDLGQLTPGVFLLEIMYFDNRREHLKLLKE